MKKTFLLLACISLAIISCGKDDEKTYTQAQLNGTWVEKVADSDGCKTSYIIDAVSMAEEFNCPTSSSTALYEDYKFDGKKITGKVFGILATFTINELTDTTLKMTISAAGQSVQADLVRK